MSNDVSVSSAEKKRGRPPKSKVVETNNASNTITETTHEFCSMSSMTDKSMYYFGFDLFKMYTAEKLASLVKDPIGNNDILREISLLLYGTNGIYTNTVDYLTAMPTLDKVIVAHGNSEKRNFTTKS